MTDRIERRRILGVGATALVLLPFAGCKSEEQTPAAATPPEGESGQAAASTKADDEAHDIELFNSGLLLEQTAILAYQAAAGLPFIASDPTIMEVAKLFMGQHEEHRDTLAKWIESLGGTPVDIATAPPPEIPPTILDEAVEEAERKRAVLELARGLEKGAADAYFQLVTQQLHTDSARRMAAEILPVEAQHVAVFDLVLQKAAPVNAALYSEQS
ncbi:ferritin-like domain-containing protein [Haliangium ochraceum]|uniref:DUF4439 domain-containing protein n=1 Tax=Haliangium ochraceum (strain DSM 14365 / JCM 11303 / SMP-2) TaxID=502025 RepID=D0LL68_HALO1|nr:ferritin-like domain-containing protein [Haliangium ochraceum]ACY18564.1 conserved hypothetical protein [Haliangium ochraceum DSM 14365]